MSVESNRPHLILVLLWLLAGIGPAEGSWEITGAVRRLADGGCRITFAIPMAVDLVVVPTEAREVFGEGSRGSALLVRGEHAMTVVRLADPADETFRIEPKESSTGWLELVPVIASPTHRMGEVGRQRPDGAVQPAPTQSLYLVGVEARLRALETELAAITRTTLDLQNRDRCFRCHIALPLAWTATLAEYRCLQTPRELLASIASNIISTQNTDGSFSAAGHSEYGVVTPSLVAAATLSGLQKFCGDDTALEAVKNAAGFLLQQPQADGIPALDFTFPPLFLGKPFAARLFADLLDGLNAAALERGMQPDPAFLEPSARAKAYLEAEGDGVEKQLWRLFAISLPGVPGEERGASAALPLPGPFLAGLSAERDPELLALREGVLREHGLAPIAETIQAGQTAPDGPFPDRSLKRRIWRLYQLLCREPYQR
ncbi:MAG TPA: hypothetical protein PLP29_06165 [Candidatus Ozemobacteraceae bacterium]|nr:hypothetical protein [Candidatus Ozemobacteraceae bacterium]